jgi:hypothetical protein
LACSLTISASFCAFSSDFSSFLSTLNAMIQIGP